MNQNAKASERLSITVFDENHNVVDHRETYVQKGIASRIWLWILRKTGFGKCYADDIMTNLALADIADMVYDRYTHISIGTGQTPPAGSDTALEAEIQTRVVATKSITTTFITNDTARFEGEITALSDITIYESGLHTAITDGLMGCRETFAGMTILSGRSAMIVWELVFTR